MKHKIRRYINTRRIKKIEKLMNALVCADNQEIVLAEERRIIDEILKLSDEERTENSKLTQPLHVYFSGLYQKGRRSIDKSTHNPSIEMFTEKFLNHSAMIRSRFVTSEMQKVVMMLILANLSIHRVQHASQLLDLYYAIFDERYKARLYIRIMTASCGSLDIEKINTLFENAEIELKKCVGTHNKCEFLLNLYMLSKGVNIEGPSFGKMVRSVCEETRGDNSEYTAMLFKEFCLCDEYLEETGEWLQSIKDKDNNSDLIQDVKALYTGKEKGLDEIPLAKDVKNNNPKKSINDSMSDIQESFHRKEVSLSALVKAIDDSKEFYQEKARHTKALEDRLYSDRNITTLELQKVRAEYWKEYEINFRKVRCAENIKSEDTVFLFVNEYSLVNGAVSFPFFLEARRRGIKCYSISPRIHLDDADASESIYDYYGFLVEGQDIRFYRNKCTAKTEIDIKNKRIIVRGMNVYQPVFEFITRYQFTYFYNYETDAWARYRTTLLVRIYDSLFRYIEKVEKWAAKNKKKVYFVSNAPHIHLAAAFRIYCEEKGYKNGLNYICTSPGYDNYFANSGNPRTETTTALNLTKNPHSRNSFLGTKESFERYYNENKQRIDEIRRKMQVYLEMQRSWDKSESRSDLKTEIENAIKKAKADGKIVILLNGKVIIDLAVKYTKGVVHDDMSEWITHAVEFAKTHEKRILLLIKPHPHENRQDLTLTSEKIDDLRSIIKCELGSNTIYLDNDMFTNQELIKFMDIGMVWNGTSALEFAAQGKKVLVADVWGHYDYPIGFVYPKTMEEYESYLLDPSLMQDPKEINDRAIAFLEYIGSEHVRIPNRYSQTTLMNFNQYESTINAAAVDDYVENGDMKLAKHFESIL